jgi:hypothetical protein
VNHIRDFTAKNDEKYQYRPGREYIEKKQGDPKQVLFQVEQGQNRIGKQKTTQQEKTYIPSGY